MPSSSDDNLYFLTERAPLALHLARLLGLGATAFFCGSSASLSFAATPALLEAPAPLLAKQWRKLFERSKALASVVVLLGGATFSWCAYRERRFNGTAKLYTSAAVALAAAVPYSMLLLHPLSERLLAKADELSTAAAADPAAASNNNAVGAAAAAAQPDYNNVHVLVDEWATVNLGRAALAGLSAVLGLLAAVRREDVVGATFGLGLGLGGGR